VLEFDWRIPEALMVHFREHLQNKYEKRDTELMIYSQISRVHISNTRIDRLE